MITREIAYSLILCKYMYVAKMRYLVCIFSTKIRGLEKRLPSAAVPWSL